MDLRADDFCISRRARRFRITLAATGLALAGAAAFWLSCAAPLASSTHTATPVSAPAPWSAGAPAAPAAPAALNARRVYRHSVVPGGVASRAELAQVIRSDKVVAAHYASFDVAAAHPVKAVGGRAVHVSYRIGDKIYWTRNKVTLAAGETLLSDGKHEVRARCANRISELAQLPVADHEPAAGLLDSHSEGDGEEGSLQNVGAEAPDDAPAAASHKIVTFGDGAGLQADASAAAASSLPGSLSGAAMSGRQYLRNGGASYGAGGRAGSGQPAAPAAAPTATAPAALSPGDPQSGAGPTVLLSTVTAVAPTVTPTPLPPTVPNPPAALPDTPPSRAVLPALPPVPDFTDEDTASVIAPAAPLPAPVPPVIELPRPPTLLPPLPMPADLALELPLPSRDPVPPPPFDPERPVLWPPEQLPDERDSAGAGRAVPEPATFWLIAAALGMLVLRRGRPRQRAAAGPHKSVRCN